MLADMAADKIKMADRKFDNMEVDKVADMVADEKEKEKKGYAIKKKNRHAISRQKNPIW